MSYLIPESKIGLQEKDIEDYLFAHPEDVSVASWLRRQYRVPSGIIDLFGVDDFDRFAVCEIKNTPIDSFALAQVCRYAYDMERVFELATDTLTPYNVHPYGIRKIVFGRSVDEKTFRESEALNVEVVLFDVRVQLVCHSHQWTSTYYEAREKQYAELASESDFLSILKRQLQLDDDERSEKKSDVVLESCVTLRGYEEVEAAAEYLAEEGGSYE